MNEFYLLDDDWELLLDRVEDDEVLPFLGAGACFGTIATGATIAKEWAKNNGYPKLLDNTNLVQVAHHHGVVRNDKRHASRDLVTNWLSDYNPPDFSTHIETHGVLASLPISTFITTNYDDLMYQALEYNGKEPVRELCLWKDSLRKRKKSIFEDVNGYQPSIEKPLIFHLHGYKDDKSSMVLTEDDYLDFLVELAKMNEREQDVNKSKMIHSVIQDKIQYNTILFIGYSFQDINFRIIFRSLLREIEPSDETKSFIIQYTPSYDETAKKEDHTFPTDEEKQHMFEVKNYLTQYYGDINIKFTHSTADRFAQELYRRWQNRIGMGTS